MFRSLTVRLPVLLTAAATVVAFAASPAHATLQIQLQSGAQTYTQSGPSPLVVIQSIGNFILTGNIGTSTTAPSLDLASVDITSEAGGGTLVIILSADGFTFPYGLANWLTQFSGNFSNAAATVTLETYLDNTNTLMGTGTHLSTLTASTTPFSLSDALDVTTTTPYSITEVLTITTTASAHLSLDASVSDAPIPEPASLTLLGSAMIALGTLARRKRKV